MELLTQSDRYVEPLCPYFKDCGGCKTQHVPYTDQVAAKYASVQRLLHPIESASADHATHTFHYRNKTEFTVSAGRWLTQHDAPDSNHSHPFTIGFFPKSSGSSRKWDGRVVAINACVLQHDVANRILQSLLVVAERLDVVAYDFLGHTGDLRNVVVRVGTLKDGSKQVMVGLSTATLSSDVGPQLASALLAALPPADAASIASIVQFVDPEMQRRHHNRHHESLRVLHGRSYIHDTILGSTFRLSLHSFFQPNTAMASVLYAHLVAFVASYSPTSPPVVWDLFCGVGSIGICLAPHAKHVVGLEIVPDAVVDAAQNAADNGVTHKMTFVCADVLKAENEAVLAALPHPDIVIVDPPRPGLSKPLIAYLCDVVQPGAIVYVSCNPSTQARDLQLMLATYAVVGSQPVDMLPHTPHMENIVYLERRHTN
ncbi:hypothetical protein DYB26_001864 [Aphanomyces astaci]|uniref:23S rRNA (Uracil-5-)-methyltransferase RumA n=1 Tax=Aphanomyces astaci TaxID=112090 RepID=A0A3R7CCM5_APHAT|nr:hypothetical protein DYB26_001864 [Aphanomyces astaci]